MAVLHSFYACSIIYILSFIDFDPGNLLPKLDGWAEHTFYWAPIAAAAVAWLAAFVTSAWRSRGPIHGLTNVLVVIALALVMSLNSQGWLDEMFPVFFNAIFATHALVLIIQGTGRLSWKRVSVGCVLFAVLAAARFTDLFDSLLMRSAIFLALGAGLFLVGNFYSKQKQKKGVVHA